MPPALMCGGNKKGEKKFSIRTHSFELSILAHTQPCAWEVGVEAGESKGHLPLHREFKTQPGVHESLL